MRQLAATKDIVQEPGVFIEWARDDRRLVAYPCSNNKVFNLCAFLPTAEAGGLGEGKHHTRFKSNILTGQVGWQAVGSKDALASGFSGFGPAVKELVDGADDNLKVWELFDMKTLPTWVRGRSALLGDAAHPFQPCA